MQRTLSRYLPLAVVVALCPAGLADGAATAGTSASTVAQQDRIDPAAEPILQRAREWAGAAALERIQSLEIDGTQGPRDQTMREFDVRLLLPDRFQTVQSSFVHAYEGSAFWMAGRSGAAVSDSPSVRANAERATLIRFVRMTITFLLRPPVGFGVSMSTVGAVDIDGLSGQGIRVSHEGRAASDVFVFDSSDGRLLGYTSSATNLAGGNSQPTVTLFGDHRDVDGVRLPFHVESRYPEVVDWRISSVATNRLTPQDFTQPRGGRR
jgi:hypothetical protein